MTYQDSNLHLHCFTYLFYSTITFIFTLIVSILFFQYLSEIYWQSFKATKNQAADLKSRLNLGIVKELNYS